MEGASRGDALTREIGRIGVARVDPQHPVLRRLVGRPSRLTGTDRPSHTAVLTHGTFAALTRWWQPNGDFYTYLDSLVPPLKLHDPSFRWSGLYSDGARQLAAQQMADWVVDQNLQQPDFFAHSHGATVANLATHRGLQLDRLVLLSWPVHDEWFPELRQRATDHRRPDATGPRDHRRPRRPDLHPTPGARGQGDVPRQRLVRTRRHPRTRLLGTARAPGRAVDRLTCLAWAPQHPPRSSPSAPPGG